MFWVVIAAWIAGIAISIANENRKLPAVVFLLGCGALYMHFSGMFAALGLALLALLTVVILLANKFEAAKGWGGF